MFNAEILPSSQLSRLAAERHAQLSAVLGQRPAYRSEPRTRRRVRQNRSSGA